MYFGYKFNTCGPVRYSYKFVKLCANFCEMDVSVILKDVLQCVLYWNQILFAERLLMCVCMCLLMCLHVFACVCLHVFAYVRLRVINTCDFCC